MNQRWRQDSELSDIKNNNNLARLLREFRSVQAVRPAQQQRKNYGYQANPRDLTRRYLACKQQPRDANGAECQSDGISPKDNNLLDWPWQADQEFTQQSCKVIIILDFAQFAILALGVETH